MSWFYYDLIILIKQYKIPYKNLGEALLFSKNQVFCLKNWKLWRALTTIEFNVFCLNFAHVSYLPISTNRCSGFFLFCLDLELFAKTKITWFLHSFFTFLLISQDLNKIKKSRTRFCRHCLVGNLCKISEKNIKLYGSWSSSKIWIFQTNK